MKVRRGRHNPYTLYVQWGEEPVTADEDHVTAAEMADVDMFLGAVRTPGFAHLIAEAINRGMLNMGPEELLTYANAWREAEYDE